MPAAFCFKRRAPAGRSLSTSGIMGEMVSGLNTTTSAFQPSRSNPRPLSPLVPSNGLIGCFSADEKLVFATVWEPYQELFQGVGRCLHSDFRLGGLKPGETKQIRGKIYVVANDVPALLKRYAKDFPEQRARRSSKRN